jgi:spore coat polysaccharide biosynthesis protein SpsF
VSERVVAVVEARMRSTRLPGKSARPLAGKPLVQHVIERIRRAGAVDEVMLATSVLPEDDVLAEIARSISAPFHRGSEEDVLARILGASQSAGATIHVQCWGDCPFVDAGEIDRVVATLRETGADLAGNGLHKPRTLPIGLDVIALRVAALERAERETRDQPYHREHGTTYLYQNPDRFRIVTLETPPALRVADVDLTINRLPDFELVERIYAALYPRDPSFGVRDVFAFLRATPELLAHPNAAGLRT